MQNANLELHLETGIPIVTIIVADITFESNARNGNDSHFSTPLIHAISTK